ncbi:hypothetical protein C8R44DRAFT_775068 [Mycena epipterygia]|nr:hypothetical protein C8R44DRAFT_775068 [Mycena epipterygia]
MDTRRCVLFFIFSLASLRCSHSMVNSPPMNPLEHAKVALRRSYQSPEWNWAHTAKWLEWLCANSLFVRYSNFYPRRK